jgi:Glycosyl hydrolases family 39
MRRFVPALACLLAIPAFALAYPPATVTDVTQSSVTIRGLDCGTRYEIRIRERNSANTAWTNTTTHTPTTAACPSRPPPASSGVLYGFHQDLAYFGDATYWNPRLDAARSIGANVSRNTLLWNIVEPSNDQWSFARADALLAQMRARNIAPLWILGRPPSWANGSGSWNVPSTNFGTFVSEYAEYAATVAAHWAGQGMMYEVWNEPNEVYFWNPVNVNQYAQLFTAARDAIMAADPTAKVGLGGITGLGASCCHQGIDFISDLVDLGVRFDYAGVHPYDSGLNDSPDTHKPFEQNFDDALAVENMLNAKGRPNVKLWLTEWGWYGCSPDDSTKATWIRRAHDRIKNEWGSFVEVSTYFMDQDQPAHPCAGVFTSSLARTPLATAFEQFRAASG